MGFLRVLNRGTCYIENLASCVSRIRFIIYEILLVHRVGVHRNGHVRYFLRCDLVRIKTFFSFLESVFLSFNTDLL
jgi:hypothetical protein